jgi:hypothetical protein
MNQPTKFHHAGFAGRFGLARVDITPPIGIYARNWGAATHDVADRIHRPLSLSALLLQSSESDEPLVYIDADLGWWKTPQTFSRFMSELREHEGIAPDRVIFALSHTHAGPPLMDAEADLPGSELHAAWMRHLLDATIHVIRAARAQTFSGTLQWARGTCGLASHRDLPDPDHNASRVLCGFNPAGQPDNTLWVGRLVDDHGTLRATWTHYACHPTTLAWDNTAISPDYVGAMRATLEQATGAMSLFLLGACGDLAPRYQYVGDTEVADRHGRQLGFASLAVLESMEPPGMALTYARTVESGAPLAVWSHEPMPLPRTIAVRQHHVTLPIKDWPTAEELETERLACNDRALEERLRRKRDIRRGLGDQRTYALPIYTWRLGDVILVGSCCEPYSVLQQELRRRFPDQLVLCANLLNGSIGYLPPKALYDCDVYPVWQTPFDRGSLELTLEAMTEAIRDVLES